MPTLNNKLPTEDMSQIERRKSIVVRVGDVPVGGDHPIVVQSMTNTDTADIDETVDQIDHLNQAGSELVRITVNNDDAAKAVPYIKEKLMNRGVTVPVIGDFHYNGHLLLTKYPEMAKSLAKFRINPGNTGTKTRDKNFCTIGGRKINIIGTRGNMYANATITPKTAPEAPIT